MMYIDRMVELISNVCASPKLSNPQKSDALEEVVYSVLCQGEMDSLEHPDSTTAVHKDMLESALRLNKILRKTGIKWDGSGVEAKDIQVLYREPVDCREIVAAV